MWNQAVVNVCIFYISLLSLVSIFSSYINDVVVPSFSSFHVFLFLDKPAQLVFIWVSFYSLKNI